MIYGIKITPTALKMLQHIQRDRQKTIENRIDDLKLDPEKRGKPLIGELSKFRSIHAAGRYRIIYQVNREKIVVIIIAIGMRKEGDLKDIYNLARKLFQSGLLGS